MEIIHDFSLTFDTQSYIDLHGESFARLMARPGRQVQLQQAIAKINDVAAPVACYESFPIEKFLHDRIKLENGTMIGGGPVVTVLGGAEVLFVAVCTVGTAVDHKIKELQAQKKHFQTMLLDELAAAAVDQVRLQLYQQIKEKQEVNGWRFSTLLSPGESTWSIHDQKTIFNLIDASAIGVTLTASGLMQPLKSLSMIMGAGSCEMGVEGLTNCDFCTIKDRCLYSRTQSGPPTIQPA
jgi:hypothetical protein